MCDGVFSNISLINIMKSVGLIALPCGTPFSCVNKSDNVDPILTLNVLFYIKFLINIGRFPRKFKSYNFCNIPLLQAIS